MSTSDLHALVVSDPDIMSGAPVFAGTRVPVEILFEYLESGGSLGDCLDEFPSVSREQAQAVLESAKEALLSSCASS